ncbi:MAG: carboxymuconolactone decarboxylase family protein [Bacillota bacterium]|nr:carboxymuconolactone decarboxylase family protein [Bacillota bacterium]
MNQLFEDSTAIESSPKEELKSIEERFVYGDVYHLGSLEDTTRSLITLAVLTAIEGVEQISSATEAALNSGCAPAEIKEAIYQCAPYVGFPKVWKALAEVKKSLPEDIPPGGAVSEETRFEQGLKVQTEIFGDVIMKNCHNAPKNQKHIQDYLSAFCFGDFYTRNGLSLKTRELLTFCIISALGGCENQVRAHAQGNKNVGNDKDTLICAITQCLPLIGFPRTLNALGCINEIFPEA